MMDVDASIATDHMMMAAQNLGLGTCWMTYFDPAGLKEEFNIPDNLEAINILEIGYADGEAKSPDRHKDMRKNPDEMVFIINFNNDRKRKAIYDNFPFLVEVSKNKS